MAKQNNSNRSVNFGRQARPKSVWDNYTSKDFSVNTERVDKYAGVPLLLNSFSIEYVERFNGNPSVTMRCINPFTGERPILRTTTKPIVQFLELVEKDEDVTYPFPIKIVPDGEMTKNGNQSHRLDNWNEEEYLAYDQLLGHSE